MIIIKSALLIFDLDDTLVHSRIDFDILGRWVREQIQLRQISELTSLELVKMSVSQLLHLAEAYDQQEGTAHGEELWEKVVEAEMEGALRATVEDGAQEVLGELKDRGFVLNILTNNSRLVAQTVLERFSLEGFIDTVMTRDEVKILKPDPAGLLLLKGMYWEQVEEMFFIGDSWIDGLAANRAQIPFIGFNCNEPRDISMIGNVSNLPELVKLLEDLCPKVRGVFDA